MNVSNCRGQHDAAPGDIGNQEWRIQPWFSYDWNCVLRHPNKDVANLISNYATHAANNENCGYSQSNRLSFYNELCKVQDFDPAYITTPCDADCSSSTGSIVAAVGKRLGISELANVNYAMTTFTMESELIPVGFERLTGAICWSGDGLQGGDIILNASCHVCIAVNDTEQDTDAPPVTPSEEDAKHSGWVAKVETMTTELPLLQMNVVGVYSREDVKACQDLLNLRGADIDVDGIFGNDTLNAVKVFQAKSKLLADGEVGALTWAALVNG